MAIEVLSVKALESKIKAATIQAAERNTRVAVSDGGGLELVVRPNGGASWTLRYRLHGQRNMYSIGPWPAVSLSKARQMADASRSLVADGKHPVEVKREARAEIEKARTGEKVLDLFDQWLAKTTFASVYEGNIRAAFHSNVLPKLGAMPVADVKRQDVISLLRVIEDRGALVILRKVRMWMHQMFEFELGKEAPAIEANPVPTGRLTAFKPAVKGHFAAITDVDQVPALMRAIDAWVRPLPRVALLLSAHTFQRPSEIREAPWSEFELEAGKWIIPAERMKTKREHWVPLSRRVVELLRMHQGLVGTVGLLFPSRIFGQPLSEATINKALKSMGYHGRHTTHGFRAMARTIMDEYLRIDPRFIEAQLSHEHDSSGLGGAYNRATFWDDRVRAMQTWSDWLDEQMRAQRSSR